MNFVIDGDACVACLACTRVCPTNAIAVSPDATLVRVMDEACIRCGLCVPECPHDAVKVSGELGRAVAIAAEGTGILVLSTEAAGAFLPGGTGAGGQRGIRRRVPSGLARGDRRRAGRGGVSPAVEEGRAPGTMIRSSDRGGGGRDPAGVPELVPYLAPVATPAVAEARYLRGLYGAGVKIVFAGVSAPPGRAGDRRLDHLRGPGRAVHAPGGDGRSAADGVHPAARRSEGGT